MTKLIIYIDMDGVLANFDKAADEHPSNGIKGYRPDLILDFSTFEPMKGAIQAVKELEEMGHDLFIATTPPWDHPNSWGQKRNWVEEYLPTLKRKMFLTHRKDLLIGDILIDDSFSRGQPEFEGTWFHFGKNGMDWKYVVEGIKSIMEVKKTWEQSENPTKKSDFLPHNLRNKKYQ
jgi:5'(3')-deoxyribonucleotidase